MFVKPFCLEQYLLPPGDLKLKQQPFILLSGGAGFISPPAWSQLRWLGQESIIVASWSLKKAKHSTCWYQRVLNAINWRVRKHRRRYTISASRNVYTKDLKANNAGAIQKALEINGCYLQLRVSTLSDNSK